MEETVVGVFEDYTSAKRGIEALRDAGFASDQIGILVRDDSQREGPDEDQKTTVLESAGAGALGGTAIGGLIGLVAGMATIIVPGIGAVIAAGPLAIVLGTAAAGAGIGAAHGAFIGGLIGLGISEEKAGRYAESVKAGRVLVTVKTSQERSAAAINAMQRASVLNVESYPEIGKARVPAGYQEASVPVPPAEADSKTIGVLNNLIEICKGSHNGFQLAAQNVNNYEMKELFGSRVRQYEEFALALQEHVRRLGGDAEPAISVPEAIQRGWLNIKAAMTIEETITEEVVLEATLDEEAENIERYREALEKDLPTDVRAVVESQYEQIQAAHRRLEEVKNRIAQANSE